MIGTLVFVLGVAFAVDTADAGRGRRSRSKDRASKKQAGPRVKRNRDTVKSVDDIVRLAQEGFKNWHQLGHVDVKAKGDLLIFSYNASATRLAKWNTFERLSRGLIVNRRTGEIVSRPWDKFFGWGEGGRTTAAKLLVATDKVDGVQGALYRDGGFKVATRSSFHSAPAQWATSALGGKQLKGLPPELTLMFEIVHPDHQIVVDYGGREDLVLLGARNRFTGAMIRHDAVRELGKRHGFTLPQVYRFDSVDAVLAATRTLGGDAEGWVAQFSDGQLFKFKGDEYRRRKKAQGNR